jgi:hypothetical protein
LHGQSITAPLAQSDAFRVLDQALQGAAQQGANRPLRIAGGTGVSEPRHGQGLEGSQRGGMPWRRGLPTDRSATLLHKSVRIYWEDGHGGGAFYPARVLDFNASTGLFQVQYIDEHGQIADEKVRCPRP